MIVRSTLIVIVAVILMVGVGSSTTRAHGRVARLVAARVPVARVVASHRDKARRVAQHILGEVQLPGRAMISPPRLAGRGQFLERPITMIFVADQVDTHRFWTTNAPPTEVLSTIRAHLPSRVRSSGAGYGGDARFVTFVYPPDPSTPILTRQLAVSAVQSGGRTIVRVDAEVRFAAPRLPSQEVPAPAHVVDVARSGARHPGSSPPPKIRTEAARTVTRRALVLRIITLVNSLPLAGNEYGVFFSCPIELVGDPTDTLTFRASPGSRPLAVLTMAADTPATIDPCAGETLKLGPRTLGLAEGGRILHAIGAILHIKLASQGAVGLR